MEVPHSAAYSLARAKAARAAARRGGAAQRRLRLCSREDGDDRFVVGPAGFDGGPPVDSSVGASEDSGLVQ